MPRVLCLRSTCVQGTYLLGALGPMLNSPLSLRPPGPTTNGLDLSDRSSRELGVLMMKWTLWLVRCATTTRHTLLGRYPGTEFASMSALLVPTWLRWLNSLLIPLPGTPGFTLPTTATMTLPSPMPTCAKFPLRCMKPYAMLVDRSALRTQLFAKLVTTLR